MQSKTLVTVCVTSVAILAIVSATLWIDLRASRQQLAEQQAQLTQAQIPVVQSAPVPAPLVQALPLTVEAQPAPPASVQLPESRPPAPPAARAEIVIVTNPERPLGMPTLTRPLEGNTPEERRLDALVQSDLAATARVVQWSTVVDLTPEQRQVLEATAIAELRRETEESLQLASASAPTDAMSVMRIKEETINRQNETSLRILQTITPHLTEDQVRALRGRFESGHASRMAALRAEREQAALSGR